VRAVVVVPENKRVEVVERGAPRLDGGAYVQLRTLEVGICGTDREICDFKYGEPPVGEAELVLGHEAIAEVVEVGPDVTWARRGDFAVPTVRRPCGSPRCTACRQGRPDFCTTSEFTERGIVRANGFMCESFVEDEQYLVPVPSAIRDVGVLVEPLTIAAKSAQEFQSLRARFRFDVARPIGLVLGAGPVGLLAAMALRAHAIETTVFSREPEDDVRADLVRAIGADYISSRDVPIQCLPEHIRRADVIFEAVGVPGIAFGALSALAPNGVLIMSGVPCIGPAEGADLSAWMRSLVLNNQIILGTVNAGRSDYELAIRTLEQFMTLFPSAVRSLIQRGPLDAAPEALETGRGIKDVVVFGDASI